MHLKKEIVNFHIKRDGSRNLSPLMLKFGSEIHFGVIQNHTAAIFEILIFRDFSGGQSSNYRYLKKNYT